MSIKRPCLIHFLAITTDDFINIKAQVNFQSQESNSSKGSSPIQSLPLLGSEKFHMKISGSDKHNRTLCEKSFESDPYGAFNFKISLQGEQKNITTLQIYETSRYPGLEIFLGAHRPIKVSSPKKLVISDFDKTLVDTKYSTPREIYRSLTAPVGAFPTVDKSLELLKTYMDKGYHPFILSASPHFYENTIRDWLYQHRIYTAGVFLKDYRQVFLPLEARLTPKDLKTHGLYKLNQLLDILLMTGIPEELILMGDNFESDPLIYASLECLLLREARPWSLWQTLKEQEAFRMNSRQDNQMLDKIHQLFSLLKSFREGGKSLRMSIFIRQKNERDQITLPESFAQALQNLQTY